MKKQYLFLISALFSLYQTFGQVYHYYDSFYFDTKTNHYCDTLPYSGIWQVGKPHKKFFDSAYSFPNAIVTDTVNPYPVNNHSAFEIIIYNSYCYPFECSPLYLSFEHKYDTDSLNDGCYLDISYDRGKTWVNIINDSLIYKDSIFPPNWQSTHIYFNNLYNSKDTIKGGISAFTGKSNGWVNSSIAWFWCWGEKRLQPVFPDTAIVRFNFQSGSSYTKHEGWMIDNINISRSICPDGINDLKPPPSYSYIYPNPIENLSVLEFSNPYNDQYLLDVYNVIGEKVKSIAGVHGTMIELNYTDFVAGIYFYSLTNINRSGSNHSGKFIVR